MLPKVLYMLPSLQVGYQASYNIYNFDQEDPASNKFDVTSCYGDFAQQAVHSRVCRYLVF